jgi:hypothetical protein
MPATRRIKFFLAAASGLCLMGALLLAWMIWGIALGSGVTLAFIAYEQRTGDASYYARLALTNQSAQTIYYERTVHTRHLDAQSIPLWTVPVVCSERTLGGWSAEKRDESSWGDIGGDQHLDPGQGATFVVPVISGAPPKRVGLVYGFHGRGGGPSSLGRAIFTSQSRLRNALGKPHFECRTAWCKEILTVPGEPVKMTTR